jgi:hypothetical protein
MLTLDESTNVLKQNERSTTMTAIPTKLYEAFEKIRLGKVNEGTKLFDKVDGFDEVKAIALAELSYFRHDWKRGILFAQDFFLSERKWLDDTVMRYYDFFNHLIKWHLDLYLLATCRLECWKESRKFWEQIKKREREIFHTKEIKEIIAYIADPQNTTKRLLESKPKLRTTGKEDILEKVERTLHFGHFGRFDRYRN